MTTSTSTKLKHRATGRRLLSYIPTYRVRRRARIGRLPQSACGMWGRDEPNASGRGTIALSLLTAARSRARILIVVRYVHPSIDTYNTSAGALPPGARGRAVAMRRPTPQLHTAESDSSSRPRTPRRMRICTLPAPLTPVPHPNVDGAPTPGPTPRFGGRWRRPQRHHTVRPGASAAIAYVRVLYILSLYACAECYPSERPCAVGTGWGEGWG